jgi:hypothetical protein
VYAGLSQIDTRNGPYLPLLVRCMGGAELKWRIPECSGRTGPPVLSGKIELVGAADCKCAELQLEKARGVAV